MKNKPIILYILLFLIIGVVIGLQLQAYLQNHKENIKDTDNDLRLESINKIEITIVAVDSNGKGKFANLITQVKDGNGLILVNINNVLADYDTQQSARIAAKLASNYTKINLDNKDVIYQIKTDADVIGGPSAGSSMAIATIALLGNKQLHSDVVITGSIHEDGTISDAGAIEQKADAAKQANAKIMLIPKGSYPLYEYKQEKSCSYNNNEYCEIKTKSVMLNTIEKLGVELKEVSNISEALKYYES